jgi:hypothetical protein
MTRGVALALLVAAAVLLATGSAGFSEVGADRSTDISVASDRNAYLGIETVDGNSGIVGGDPVTVFRLTDRFLSDVTLTGLTTGSSVVSIVTSTPAGIGDASAPLEVQVRCTAETNGKTAQFTITAEGPDVEVSADRAVTITCEEPEVQSVNFRGCGNAHIEADDAVYPLTVTKTVENPSGGTSTSTVTIDSDGTVGGSSGGKLVAVEADGETYTNDNTCQSANSGGAGQSG